MKRFFIDREETAEASQNEISIQRRILGNLKETKIQVKRKFLTG
jgi:hypothetical protein